MCLWAVLAVLAAAGCGIPSDQAPEALPGGVVSGALTSPDAPGGPQATPAQVSVFLVRAGAAVAVARQGTTADLGTAIRALLRGPTAEEVAAGLRTAITPGTRLRSAQVTDGTAVLDLTSAFVEVGGEEQILAVAQVVLTATARPGVERVSIALDGEVVEVPRADGTLAAGPLTAADYAALRDPSGGLGIAGRTSGARPAAPVDRHRVATRPKGGRDLQRATWSADAVVRPVWQHQPPWTAPGDDASEKRRGIPELAAGDP